MTRPTKAKALDATIAAGNQWADGEGRQPVECSLCDLIGNDEGDKMLCGPCPVSVVMGESCHWVVLDFENTQHRRNHVLTSVALMIAVMNESEEP